jgi:phosphorylcholine metabolism protein LicD
MDTINLNIEIDDFIKDHNNVVREIMKKLLLVIQSINSTQQIPATRKYIDLWYRKYGTKNKELVEIYFKSKKSELR